MLAVLVKRFPSACADDLAAAANAIVGLEPEYVALNGHEVGRFDCVAGARAFTAGDIATGLIRVYRRVDC